MTISEFKELFACRVGGEWTDEQITALHIMCENLEKYNAQFNLTAIKEPSEVLSKHVADCLACGEFIRKITADCGITSGMILDVGSGAGFPSLPVAVTLPDFSVTALDSTAKKINYIKISAEAMGLKNVDGIATRAEELAVDKSYRGSFDVVTARAVSRLNVLLELCAPFLKIGGVMVAMKGAIAEEEAREAASAARKLGLAPAEIISYNLPNMEDSRAFVVYRKISVTPDSYPRPYSKITKKPL